MSAGTPPRSFAYAGALTILVFIALALSGCAEVLTIARCAIHQSDINRKC